MFAAEHRAPRRALPLEDKEREADGFREVGGRKSSGAGRETVAGGEGEGIGRAAIVMEPQVRWRWRCVQQTGASGCDGG